MLPKNLVIIRHGQSEANVFQSGVDEQGRPLKVPAEFTSRHDSNMRLSARGVEQAQAAGDWLRAHGLDHFDRHFVSPHTRTRETAAHLGLNGLWRADDRWRERDWGEISSLSRKDQARLFPESMRLKKLNEWYWKPLGGESLATGVRARFRSAMDALYRINDNKEADDIINDVVAVAHGELIRVAEFDIEQMTPDQWIAIDANPAYKVQNCMIVQYTRVNPETGEETNTYKWRRAICPWDESLSWDNGEWQRFDVPLFTDEQLLNTVDEYPRLLAALAVNSKQGFFKRIMAILGI